MKIKHAIAFGLFIVSSVFASAQAPVPQTPAEATQHFSDGFAFHDSNVVITADGADGNYGKSRMDLRGMVKMRPEHRPKTVEIAATNRAGVPFPGWPAVIMQFRGNFRI